MLPHALADDGIDQPSPLVVAIDQQFARCRAVGETDDARLAVERRLTHEARHQPRVQRAEIAHRVPHVIGGYGEGNVLVDGSHSSVSIDGNWSSSLRAKRSNPRLSNSGMDCFVACAPRNDDGDYVHTASTLLPSGSSRNAA